jgi:hypothetical protein
MMGCGCCQSKVGGQNGFVKLLELPRYGYFDTGRAPFLPRKFGLAPTYDYGYTVVFKEPVQALL